MVANFTDSSQKLTNSSKSNPCPVCGRTKDGDCRISHDGNMVLCHQNFDHDRTQQPDLWHCHDTSSDNRCGVYVFKEPTTKSIRPKQTRYWEYPARDGSRLVRVCREDDGAGNKKMWQQHWDGSKWQNKLGKVDRADIPIYRYAEVREAIAKGEPVHTVEGEPCADIFWKLGLAATTNIGGGGKFTQSDAQDLQGAGVVVIVPDRDKKGIDHADKLAEYFPDALWLYPFPESKVWGNLPKDHGLDIADWIEHHNITAEDIKGAIGHKKPTVTNKPPTSTKLSKREAAEQAREVLRSGQDELTTNLDLDEIREAVGMGAYDWEHKIIKPLKRDMDGERFKLELKGLLQMEDPVERCRQIALLAPKYSMNAGTVKEAMAAMKSRTETPESRLWSLDEVFSLQSEGLQWVIPELLPCAETVILSASPKCGKSLLAVDLAFCVATGEEKFLGQNIKVGKVLLVSVDESLNSTRSKLLKRGFRSQDSDNLKVLPQWDITQTAKLEAFLEDYRPDVVIIDSLKRICKGSAVSENSAEFSDNIYALKELLTRYGAAGVLIHHSNKNADALGVDRLRGSSAIAGSVWGVWQVDHIPKKDPNNSKKLIIDPKDPKRIFSCFPRDAEGQTLDIEINLENNSWLCHGLAGEAAEAAQQRETIRERILRTLQKHNRPLPGSEIIETAELTEQRGSAYSELNRMVGKKVISAAPAPGDKRYTLYSLPNCHAESLSAKSSTPPPPPISLPIAIYESENHIQQGFKIDSKIDSRYIAIDSIVTVKSEMLSTANDCEERISEIDSKLPLSQGGGEVKCVSAYNEAQPSEPVPIAPLESKPTEPTEPTDSPIAPQLKFTIGDRVKISPEYIGTQEFRGKRATIIEVYGDGLCRIEFECEIEISGCQPTKATNINGLVLESVADVMRESC